MRHGVGQINTEVISPGPNYSVGWPAYVIPVILTVDQLTLQELKHEFFHNRDQTAALLHMANE